MGDLGDVEAIRRTLAGYCQTCDDGRFEAFGDLFAVDGVLQVPGVDPVTGRDAIRAFMERAQPPERRGKHLCGEPLVVLDASDGTSGDTATATASTDFVFVGRDGSGGWDIVAVGRYTDRLSRDSDDVWRFTTRTITML